MPLFYQHNINEFTKLAIWHITEEEDFFLQKVPLKRDVSHAAEKIAASGGPLSAVLNYFLIFRWKKY